MSFFREDSGYLQEAPNFVYGPGYTLFKEEKDIYSYPTEGGWHWFDTEEEAIAALGVEPEPQPEEPEEVPGEPPV